MGPTFVPRPAEGLRYPNVVQMFAARVDRSPHAPALRYKQGAAWTGLTWSQWWTAAREVAAGLRVAAGVAPGDRVAIAASTRVEWVIADLAIAMAGAISVPIYPTLPAEQVSFILADAGCKVAIVDDARRLRRDGLRWGPVEAVVSFDGPNGREAEAQSWSSLRAAGTTALRGEGHGEVAGDLDEIAQQLGLEDPFTFVYTSGTTGRPKGVVLNHRNLVYEAWAIKNVIPVDDTDEQLLVLPLAHIFARHLVWGAVEQGVVTAIGEGEHQFVANMQELAPTYVGAVPRTYARLLRHVLDEVYGRNPLKRKAFEVAFDVGRRVSACRQRGQVPPSTLMVRYAVAERMFFQRIREVFGGRLRFFICGGAPLHREVAEFFHACGLLVLEGYGMTETTGATNVNRPDRFRFGTVGPAMPGCEVRLADDGEVLVRGHNVMARYHGLPEETAAVFDEQGWFRTGDIGELVDGFLRITDRKRDLFKTNSGKYVAPGPIEQQLERHPGIAHAVVFGEGRPYPVALIAIDEAPMMEAADREGLGCRMFEDLVVHPRIRQIVQGFVDQTNAPLARWEAIRRFALVPRPLSIDRGELTPTRKVRRKVVAERYAALLDALYEPDEVASPLPRPLSMSS